MSESQDKKIAELEKELEGIQQMLFHVLNEVGEPVFVSKADLKNAVLGDKMISIIDNEEENAFIFSIVSIEDMISE